MVKGTVGSKRKRRERRFWLLVGGGVIIALGLMIYPMATNLGVEQEFLELAREGRSELSRVRTDPDRGRDHLGPNADFDYGTRYPTSGPHADNWITPGVYTEPQRPSMLVHALEHGNIVIYYEEPGQEAMDQLRRWANLYDDMWSGLVLTPMPGLGQRLVLTAWTKRLHLPEYDAAAAAAFIDAYRGRGPENPVR